MESFHQFRTATSLPLALQVDRDELGRQPQASVTLPPKRFPRQPFRLGLREAMAALLLSFVVMGALTAQDDLNPTTPPAPDEAPVPWTIHTPRHNSNISSSVASLEVCITKPEGRAGTLNVTYWGANGALRWSLPVTGAGFQFVTLSNGLPLAAGRYELALVDEFRPQEIMTRVEFHVRPSDAPEFPVPSIDSPLTFSVFPPKPRKIRFAGYSEATVYLVLVAHKKQLMSQKIVVPEGETYWSVDVPWIYGRGDFSALIFNIDPYEFETLPSDACWFTIADDERRVPTPIWAIDPLQYER